MTLVTCLVSGIGFLDAAIMYYVIQLGRAVQISVVMLAVIFLLRKVLIKRNMVFFRGILWSILLLAPFMGKMRWIYETRIGVKLLFYWQNICSMNRLIPYVYVMGMMVMGTWIYYKRKRLKQAVKSFDEVELQGIKIAVSDYAVSPFTMGLIRPVIVVPRIMLENMSDEELRIILLHERVHIRLGHLWCFWLWDILRVLLWADPFLHICTKWFRADMEDICDKVTIQKGQQSAYFYGCLLIKSIRMLKNEPVVLEPSAAFAGEKQYMNIKYRMEHVAAYKPYSSHGIFMFAAVCGFTLVLSLLAVIHISYPRYTEQNYLQIYNQNGTRVLVDNSEILQEAIQIGKKEIYINKEKIDHIFAERNIEEEMFFLFFGGYSKIPGFGGGGNGVFVKYEGQEGDLVIPYIDGDSDWRNRLLKYL
ncbi:MAG: M56 family metallopeptidase [Lachnospiraceae bacterium]|nr:M56 family metallopeptidase [Lachnospiraceae bacterium]